MPLPSVENWRHLNTIEKFTAGCARSSAYGTSPRALGRPTRAVRGSLIVPTLSLIEAFKRVSRQRNEDEALRAIAVMEKGRIVDFGRTTALEAARLSILHGLAMADSVMLATAQRSRATLWTQDSDFDGLPGTRYYAKR